MVHKQLVIQAEVPANQFNIENVQKIRAVNAILSQYYGYIREYYPDITIVQVADLPEYFTDENYDYGAVPQHLNEIVNQKIAGIIGEKIHAEK